MRIARLPRHSSSVGAQSRPMSPASSTSWGSTPVPQWPPTPYATTSSDRRTQFPRSRFSSSVALRSRSSSPCFQKLRDLRDVSPSPSQQDDAVAVEGSGSLDRTRQQAVDASRSPSGELTNALPI